MAARRPRSPKYPRLPLREAIERVGQVYRAEHTHKVEKLAVAKDLGYGSLNGASVSLIGTLKSYGLLQEDKEGVRVTDDAVIILRAPEGDPERAEALRRVAFAPRVFDELREAFGDDPSDVPSETTLRFRLEKKGFLEKAADEAIRTYRDNLEHVSGKWTEYTAAEEPVDDQPVEVEVQSQQTVGTRAPSSIAEIVTTAPPVPIEQGSFKEFLHIFTQGCEIRLLVDGVVTQEAIDRLIAHLELDKDDLPSRSETEQTAPSQPVVEQPAIEMPAHE